MIDFHMHVLPRMDDGSKDTDTSIAMLERSAAYGVDTIAATPHFYADDNSISGFLARRRTAYDKLTEAVGDREDLPRLRLGAEVLYFGGMSAAEELDRLCLEGTDLLLLEMPFSPWADRVLREVASLQRSGLQVVAAHIERYFDIQPRRTMEAFFDLGTLIQCNGSFFLSRWTARRALRMLHQEQIQFLGSDAHNLSTRCPNLGEAMAYIEKKLGREPIAQLEANEEIFVGGNEGSFYE